MLNRVSAGCGLRVALGLALFAVVCACAGPSKEVYVGYLGPERAETEVVTLRLGDAGWARIDNLDTPYSDFYVRHDQYGVVKLLPGRYRIEWGHVFGFSVLVNPAGLVEYERSETLSLSAGHAYTLRADRTTGHGYRIFFWIEDNTANTVVAGVRKP